MKALKFSKVLILLLFLVISIFTVGCKKTNNNEEDPDDKKPPIDEKIDVDKFTSPNIKIHETENDPNFLDGKKYEYTGKWATEEFDPINLDYIYAGLYNPDGTEFLMPTENKRTGQRIFVTDFGGKANDPDFDNTEAVKNAIKSASYGDEIFFTAGKYYFQKSVVAKPIMAHISVPSGVNITGAGIDKTFLVSKFSEYENTNSQTTTIGIIGEENITISALTITAEVPEDKMPQPDPITGKITSGQNNPIGNRYAPKFGIKALNNDINLITQNIVVKNVKVEYFQVSGVDFTNTIASTVKDSIIENATDLGPGGRGYGVTIQGLANKAFHTVGTNLGSRYNVVTNVEVNGPYIRHGIILSYVTHNNLIYNNRVNSTANQSIDLHGEDEFLNVVTKNTIKDGANSGIGLGNSGSSHAETGPANIIYDNLIDNYTVGIQVILNTPDTVIIKNNIKNIREGGVGIDLVFAPNSLVKQNILDGIAGDDGVGIAVKYSYVYYQPELGVVDVYVVGNTIKNINAGAAIYLTTYGDLTIIKQNEFENVKTETIDTKKDFVVPEKSDYTTEVIGQIVYPVKEANINRGSWNHVSRNAGYFYFKGSHTEREFNRMIYYDWDVSKLKEEINESGKIVLRLSVTSKSALQNFVFYGIENFHDNWDELTMTWGNAPFVNNLVNNPELLEDPTGIYSTLDYPYLSEVYDPEGLLTEIGSFQVLAIDEAYITYYIDITDYVKSLETGRFTMILANPTADEAYSSVRNMIKTRKDIWPAIIVEGNE